MSEAKFSWLVPTVCGLLVVLLVRFLSPLLLFDVPLGYDPGLYRYLFIKHAAAWPPFTIGDVEPWARSHPLGLFIFTGPLLKLGLPVDWFVGWLWNIVPMGLLLLYAWLWSKREGTVIGVLVLVAGLVSIPYYDGFVGMYWKTYVALFWLLLTFYGLERKQWWSMVPAILTLVTHHQTGLVLALAVSLFYMRHIPTLLRTTTGQRSLLLASLALMIAALVYYPIFSETITTHLITLVTKRGDAVPAGAFPPLDFFARTYAIWLALGCFGFGRSVLMKRRLSVWHWSVLVCLVFVVAKLFFYRRFMLQLDFFLLPFIARGLRDLWLQFRQPMMRTCLLVAVLAQIVLSLQVMHIRQPVIDAESLALISALPARIPESAYVLALENQTPLWMRGWLPNHRVAGPGLLSLSWSVEQWEQLLYGTNEDRRRLLNTLRGPVYFVLTAQFHRHYQDQANALLTDPCIEQIADDLLHSRCSPDV